MFQYFLKVRHLLDACSTKSKHLKQVHDIGFAWGGSKKKLTTLATCSRTGLYYTGITTHAFIQTRQPQTGRCINVCTLRVDECCKTHSTIIVNIHRMTEKSELRKQELHKVGHPL